MKQKSILITLILVFIICFAGCTEETETYSATCGPCNRTYSYQSYEHGNWASRNVKCINSTGMCKNCYENFCYATGRIPKDY